MSTKPDNLPEGLDQDGAQLWVDITSQFELNAGEKAILEQACSTLDLIADMSEAVRREGPLTQGSTGQLRINPAIPQIAVHRTVFDKLILSLALPLDGETVGKRRSPQNKQAAVRWNSRPRRGRIATVGTNSEKGA